MAIERREVKGRGGHGVAALLRRHWLFAGLLIVGTGLRAIVVGAYTPAIFGITDSYWYLEQAEDLQPAELRPFGYPLFLRLLPLGWGLEVVTVVQHALGIGVAILLYAALLRLGVRPWLGALGAAPALLDAYLLNVEHQVLAETLFHLLVVGACVLLVWQRPVSWQLAGASGALLAAAALTRSVGVVLVLSALVAAILLAGRGRRLMASASLLVAFLAPLGAYAVWFHSYHDVYGLTRQSGRFLYGRVASIADCSRFTVPNREQVLCPAAPAGQRLNDYDSMWGSRTPVADVVPPPGTTRDEVAGRFARRVIRNQPFDYLRLVGRDLIRGFTSPVRRTSSSGYRVAPWQFHEGFPIFYQGQLCPPGPGASARDVRGCERRARTTEAIVADFGSTEGEANSGLTSILRGYGRFAYLPAPAFLAGLVLAGAALAGLGRARVSGLRAPLFLFAGAGLAIAVASSATSSFSWRYMIPQLVLLPPAAALALEALAGPQSGRAAVARFASRSEGRGAPD